jgi:hypothetical protein|tara:strand:+ start:91 stop:300 length:210 start_codon:yes stop_codon:yes gene_type:complete
LFFINYTHYKFFDNFHFIGFAYDIATDNGVSFTSTNEITTPAKNISALTIPPLGNGTKVSPPVAEIRIG